MARVAKPILASKTNIRVLACGTWGAKRPGGLDYKRVTGGLLVQDADLALHGELRVVSARAPTEAEMRDLLFAWKVAKFVKSNAIVYAKGNQTRLRDDLTAAFPAADGGAFSLHPAAAVG